MGRAGTRPMIRTAPFSMRLPPDLKAELQALADRDRRSLTNYIEGVLLRHLEREKAHANDR
jgi:predicted transcriptional regulator